ncbi:MAG: DNA cytosine methyltransferase, partial [Alistipes sp.]
QGFGDDYVLLGTQEEQKKFLGNAVVTQMATAWAEAVAKAIILDIWPQIETARKAVSDFTAAIRECFL